MSENSLYSFDPSGPIGRPAVRNNSPDRHFRGIIKWKILAVWKGSPYTRSQGMSPTMDPPMVETFVPFFERRGSAPVAERPTCERRQFGNSHAELSPEAAELAQAIDQYKLMHRRRFVTFDEILAVVKSLGYHR